MIDIHTHILYGLDDGAADPAETLAMLQAAEADGTTRILATPHHIAGANSYTRQELLRRFEKTKRMAAEAGLAIRIDLGSELFLDDLIEKSVEDGDAPGLAGTPYLLLEFSMHRTTPYAEGVLSRLVRRGYRPVVAHPERCRQLRSDSGLFSRLRAMGCLFQVNAGTLLGREGIEAEAFVRRMLEEDAVHFVASDCHSPRWRPPGLTEAYERTKELAGAAAADRIFYTNPATMLDTKSLEVAR